MPREINQSEVYQIKIRLRQVNPAIWRRLLIKSDCTISDLHYTIQIAMGWTDSHLHQFIIYGKDYGISYAGGVGFSDDPKQVQLKQFRFCLNERFVYEYNFIDHWQVEIRIEKFLQLDSKKEYPFCIGGARTAPQEDCGGTLAFMKLRQEYPPGYVLCRVIEILKKKDAEKYKEEFYILKYWLGIDQFNQEKLNQQLSQYFLSKDDSNNYFEEVIVCT